uniref:Uncharacterized protein n=1 Tax=Candidatus Kentrum sp. LPFa TaxID=2126335 RepID=A0A450XP42_9GAMM|nr:MAG: hypothetical protein BECKLPF1236A_GA0070988_108701 [Candidatus Kentron sp. LPFa]
MRSKTWGLLILSQVKTVADLLAKDGLLKQMFKGTLEQLLKAESFRLSSAFCRREQSWQQSERERSQNL